MMMLGYSDAKSTTAVGSVCRPRTTSSTVAPWNLSLRLPVAARTSRGGGGRQGRHHGHALITLGSSGGSRDSLCPSTAS